MYAAFLMLLNSNRDMYQNLLREGERQCTMVAVSYLFYYTLACCNSFLSWLFSALSSASDIFSSLFCRVQFSCSWCSLLTSDISLLFSDSSLLKQSERSVCVKPHNCILHSAKVLCFQYSTLILYP